VFQEKILENLQKQRLWEYFPPNSKKRKRKGKEMERYIFFVYITLNISGGGLLVFLDDEIKIIDLFVMLKKYRIDFTGCGKVLVFRQNGLFLASF